MDIDFIFDENKGEFVIASKTERIASRIIAKYVFELSPGGEIYVSTSVTNRDLYGWLKRKGLSILNKLRTNKKFEKIILEAMKKNGQVSIGWTIEKGLKGKYFSLGDKTPANDDTWKIIMNGTPMEIIEQIATALCKEFHQETVMIHDLEKNTYKYWAA